MTGSNCTASSLLVDTREASRLLAISPRTLWSLTACGAIESRKIGRSVRYSPADLQAWVAAGCPSESLLNRGNSTTTL